MSMSPFPSKKSVFEKCQVHYKNKHLTSQNVVKISGRHEIQLCNKK